MTLSPDLSSLLEIYNKCRLPHVLVSAGMPSGITLDLGIREQLGLDSNVSLLAQNLLSITEESTIYKFTDAFMCSYVFMQLPGFSTKTVLTIGPYLATEPTLQQLMEVAETLGLSPSLVPTLKTLISSLPSLSDERLIFAPLEVFCDKVWGGNDRYSITNVNYDLMTLWHIAKPGAGPVSGDTAISNMQIMERRYAHENQLIEAVSRGLGHKARNLLSGFSQLAMERRTPDPVRNLKNYCIITNTLLRKAAEQGGVHPIYLDATSSSFATRIESTSSAAALSNLMLEMVRSYCRLVNKQSTRRYSPPVQKAIVIIDFDLSADLSLRQLAEMQNISPSYLSSLFKKETGKTITEYVNEKRINLAAQLLSSTKLQIQTIAIHCGIPDSNYFSKIFKKYTGSTPKEYRQHAISRLSVKGGKS